MTRTFLAAVALTLGAVVAAHAGERLGRPEWASWSEATGTQADTPLPSSRPTPGPSQTAPVTGPASTSTPAPTLPSATPLPAPWAPDQHGPAAALPPPHLGPGVQAGCAGGCAGGTACGSSCWERLWGWATFHGERTACCGGCCGHGCGHCHCTSCDGYHCFPPLYVYFLHPCKECAGAASSESTSSVHPGFWRNVWATGHHMFSLPTGCGCPSIQ